MKKSLLLSFLLMLMGVSSAYAEGEPMDSVEISLLTCSPHEEIYSLYGHTAIRVYDKRTGEDIAVNYGMFSFGKPYFVLRFIFGLTDYEMGITTFDRFCEEYRYYGSSVTQQTVNLTAKEKQEIIEALNVNYLPQNRVYRYNIFYDNCTTRAYDMILQHINQQNGRKVTGTHLTEGKDYTTFRTIVHACTQHHPWVMFGNDMLLGLKADRPISKREWLFLPAHAMRDLDQFHISTADTVIPLVKEKQVVVPVGVQIVEQDFPIRPRVCALILLVITILIILIEYRTNLIFWGFDAIQMLVCGLSGIVLTMMLFSHHPTVNMNLQYLLLNPLPLFFIYRMIHRTRKGIADRQYILWIILICLFLIGSIWQDYAEGIMIVASSLLVRNLWRIKRNHV